MSSQMKTVAFLLAWLALLISTSVGQVKESVVPAPDRNLSLLKKLIKPQPNESPWREIDWLTDVTEARRRAVAEDKPVVIFTAADGSPLGRT